MRDRNRGLQCLAAAAMLLLVAATGGAAATSLSLRESWGDVFGGREATFHVAAEAAGGGAGRLGWALMVEGRAVGRGEVAVPASAGDAWALPIVVPMPAVKPGVALAARLEVTLTPDGGGSAASVRRDVWVFPEDPFADRQAWLAALGLVVFDPVGRTAMRLEQAGVPFRRLANPDALSSITNGLLVVGEGLALESARGLSDAMVGLASRGVPVLCLGLAEGRFALPGSAGIEGPAPRALGVARREIIRRLDKRLDAAGWPPDGTVGAGTLGIEAWRGGVQVVAGPGAQGWSWLAVEYGGRGRLVVCMADVVARWDDGPAPRFLFVRLLEHVSRGQGNDNREEAP